MKEEVFEQIIELKMESNNLKRTVLVADGSFPTHEIPLGYLGQAARIICCDGSVKNLTDAGYIPEAIVGDMDSIDSALTGRFADRIFKDENQDTNDLTKAVEWCKRSGYDDLVIVGATGKREDHTIGNVSLLVEYVKDINVIMATDSGIFLPLLKSAELPSFPGQQVSVFSVDPDVEITSTGLRYPLLRTRLSNWWTATLNEATGDRFSLEFFDGRLIVYLKYMDM
jgi:thiamine pyrophosphokinase